MSDRLRLAICTHHGPEVREVLRCGGIEDVDVVEFPSRCGRPPLTRGEVEEFLDGADPSGVLVFGGPCMNGAANAMGLAGVQASGHCLENFVGESVVAGWVKEGAYLVSPGWVSRWRQHLADWGFDRQTATAFFGEVVDHVLLVDTGVDPAAEQNAHEFAKYIGVSARSVPIRLDRFGETVRQSVASWRLQVAPQDRQRAHRHADTSLYAMAFAQLGRFAGVGTEQEVVERIFDMFEMLFGAGSMSWMPWIGGEPGEAITRSRANGRVSEPLRLAGAPLPSVEPLVLRIERDDRLLGVLEIADLAQPDRREEYLNLALSLRGACALAIANSRAWSELHQARELLARQADAYRILAESADAMLVLDGERTVRFANLAAQDLLGAQVGQSLEHEIGPAGLEVVDVQGRTRQVDCRLERIEWEGSPARLATLRDVTEQRNAEETVRRSQKMNLLGQLASSVAHDFNNVLQAIGGSLEIVQRAEGLGDRVRRRVDEALEASERGAGIARRLLLFSRPSSKPDRTVDVVAEVARMQPLLRQLAGDRIRLEVRCESEDLCIVAGDGQLEAVLLNLVTNARDAQGGRGEILVEVGDRDGELRLAVSDRGQGITPGVMKRIFEPFFTTKSSARGTGLGLPTVLAAVERMGGRLDVQSEVGKGSRFEVRLPLVDAAELSASVVSTVAPGTAARAGSILVVDDEVTIRTALTAALTDAGYQAVSAPNGPTALRLMADTNFVPDLLMTDVSMPEMDGFELARAARARHPGLRVMFISGLADITFPGLGLDPGHVRVLAKPFRLVEALARVDEALSAD